MSIGRGLWWKVRRVDCWRITMLRSPIQELFPLLTLSMLSCDVVVAFQLPEARFNDDRDNEIAWHGK